MLDDLLDASEKCHIKNIQYIEQKVEKYIVTQVKVKHRSVKWPQTLNFIQKKIFLLESAFKKTLVFQHDHSSKSVS